VFLLLNKIDLFREKLKTTPVSSIYESFLGPDVTPGNSNLDWAFERAREFFLHRFLQRVRHGNREIFHHFTCAIDSQCLRVVFPAMMDVVLCSAPMGGHGCPSF